MNATTTQVKILSVEAREVPALKQGESPTTFLSFTIYDGGRPQKLWAFAEDFQSIPQENATGVFDIALRAKAGSYGPYLSVRALSFTQTASE